MNDVRFYIKTITSDSQYVLIIFDAKKFFD